MSIGEECTECPLCMEPLEMDDINFFPCTCGYQICRFCWHRIRTDENGLCPACRKQYPEDPAEFKPLTEDELQRIKKERRQKDLQRKQKAAENRKHLANVRVVQRNLVFVVGLSQRLADAEVLKKHEYFGKFGKIHKVVINQSTSYAGSQGPSASAYVTYLRTEDALRAIQAVNNVFIDGRTLKASLGTTKYCSHFLKGTQCPKPDCMYLHELGEEAASFTKEEMQQGKHTDYEHSLIEQILNCANHVPTPAPGKAAQTITANTTKKKECVSPVESPDMPSQVPPNTTNRDAWPSLASQNPKIENTSRLTNGNRPVVAPVAPLVAPAVVAPPGLQNGHNRAPGNNRHRPNTDTQDTELQNKSPNTSPQSGSIQPLLPTHSTTPPLQNAIGANRHKFPFQTSDPHSLFSNSGFSGKPLPIHPPVHTDIPTTEIPDSMTVTSSTDWQAAFGFPSKKESNSADDDLGFDPWEESTKVLSEIIETETVENKSLHRSLPPGFNTNHIPISAKTDHLQSNMFGFMGLSGGMVRPSSDPLQPSHMPHTQLPNKHNVNLNQVGGVRDWQEGLRALLPNINISFGTTPVQPQHNHTNNTPIHKPFSDPAIVTSAVTPDPLHVADADAQPHWMRSLQQLTEGDTAPSLNHSRLPFVQQFQQFQAPGSWSSGASQNPPPGFQNPLHPTPTEPHTLTEGLQ